MISTLSVSGGQVHETARRVDGAGSRAGLGRDDLGHARGIADREGGHLRAALGIGNPRYLIGAGRQDEASRRNGGYSRWVLTAAHRVGGF